MYKKGERVYNIELPAVSEADLENFQYDLGPSTHHDGNPDSVIIGAIIPQAGKFRRTRYGIQHIDRSQTAIIIATDGNDGINIVPAENSHEKHEIPFDKTLRIPLYAALIMIQQENLPATAQMLTTLNSPRSHSAHPHQGDQVTESTKMIYRRSQIGLNSAKNPKHRRLTIKQAMGPDLIPF